MCGQRHIFGSVLHACVKGIGLAASGLAHPSDLFRDALHLGQAGGTVSLTQIALGI